MPSEARLAFLPITGADERETVDAAFRFAASLRDAIAEVEAHPAVADCATLAARAFGGEAAAWAPLVAAVNALLSRGPAANEYDSASRRELYAFVRENADLL